MQCSRQGEVGNQPPATPDHFDIPAAPTILVAMITNLTAAQLRKAASIQGRIETLQQELTQLLGQSATTAPTPTGRRPMSAAAKAKMSAKMKAAWARRKAGLNAKPAAKAKGKMNAATKAKLSAKLKAYWAKRKAAKK